jgi:hypothetical protein
MNDMAMTIEELRSAAATINDAANWLAQQFSGDAEAAPVSEAKPEKQKPLTLEQVRAFLAKKAQNGYTAEVKALLIKYGAEKLSAIDPSKYEALLKDAEDIKDE